MIFYCVQILMRALYAIFVRRQDMYFWTCWSFKSANHKNDRVRKFAECQICGRSAKHHNSADLRFAICRTYFGPPSFENYQVSNLLQCWTNVLHHEIFLKRCFWSYFLWCHFLRNFYVTWKRMQKGNLSKINPALIGIDTSDLGYEEHRERIYILRKIQGPPPPLRTSYFFIYVTKG